MPATRTRHDVRNVAIVAHVDHGKTTLVDAMLRQTGAFRSNQAVVDRVMDSMDLEREKGITILAKQTTIEYGDIRLNIVDTPGHADFGGEVERSLLMVDSVLLLVDAAEGPLPQTRYVLQKAMARRLPVIVALNKIDRSDARPAEVLDAVYELFIDLGADEHQIEFPVLYTNARAGTATTSLDEPGEDLRPLLDLLVDVTPAPTFQPDHPLQLLVTNLSANDYVGRMAVGRLWNGTIRVGQRISVVREEADDTAGAVEPGRTVVLTGTVTSLQTAHGIERVDIENAGPGDIVSVAGLPEVTIGDTLTDPGDPRPLPRLDVDAPTLRMTFGVNTSPLAGREGKFVTSRQIKARLDKEVLGNVSIEVRPAEGTDAYEVLGRGELQLAVLIEQMRREGYELTASRPEVLLRTIEGEVHEPYERVTIDIPPEYIGEVQGAMAGRKGRLEQMSTDTDGRVRMEFVLPVRGLIGYRGQLLTDTRGTALLHQIGEGYGPWAGEVTHRTSGVLVADRAGVSNAYALFNLQDRSELLIGSGVEVYEGMIVGENSRPDDMDVNATKEKKLTNIRTHAHDEALRLTPPRELTLESALEFIAGDELVEVTPLSIRLRKRILSQHDRRREAGRNEELRRTTSSIRHGSTTGGTLMVLHRSRRARLLGSTMLAALLMAITGVPTAVASVDRRPAAASPVAPTALGSGQMTVVKVTDGFSSPLGVTHAGDGTHRLFVVEQAGRVRIVQGRRITGTFLDIRSKVLSGGERGLLGLAFHPDFATNGFLFVYYTEPGGDVVIARMQANAAKTFASALTLDPILRISHSLHSNHNGGALAFGPDGYLYTAVGDGGGAGDPQENGQNVNSLLGKVLRINPTLGASATYAIPADNPFVGMANHRGEIWDYGLRNPWRITFDRSTGDLYIADVGQSRREEVNLEDVADPGGNNYGWDVMEGSLCYEPSTGCNTSGKVLPVAQYSHTYGCSITGGYVYRGSHVDLQGLYVYGDYCSGRLWTMNATGTGETIRRDTSLNISSFGESESGELFLTDLNGSLYRVIAPEFSDIATSTFLDDIHWLFYQGITTGCGGGKFCPRAAVTRVQMALFLVRAFDYPPTATDYFTDDNGIVGESSINALAEAGVTGGCAPMLFCPTRPVTRAQMALFLDRALNLPPTATDFFDDDDGVTGEAAINRLAAAGITGGCATRRFCPSGNVTREQMAAFLHRALT